MGVDGSGGGTSEAKARWVASLSLASCRGQPLRLAEPLPHAS